MRKKHSQKHLDERHSIGNMDGSPAMAFFSESERKMFVFSEDILINQLKREGPLIEKSFDALCADDLVELSRLFSLANGLIYSGLSVATQKEDELRLACAQLMLNGANSLASATAVLRMGYVLQPGILIRAFLEAISTTLHLLQYPQDIAAYNNHSLKSTKTIAAAKRVLPPFGHIYRHFSENFAHIGQLHKSITPIRVYTENHDALNVNLSSLRLAAWLLYVSAELVFNDIVIHPRYWHPIEQGYTYNPSEQEKEWMERFLGLNK
jgi:hypothetical protein